MKQIFIILLSLLWAITSPAIVINENYKSGKVICADHADELKSEHSKWIEVPVNYAHPLENLTPIYAYTKKEFNPQLPSVIYFAGGPGVSARSVEFSLPHFNVIFFEQRGISCSRPNSKELFLDPKFYSSENTAQDALRILDSYKIKKATIFGHSYGTIPATIFASKFPERSQSLILEGVIYNANETLWLAKKRDLMLQNLFDSLPANLQDKIIELSNDKEVSPSWYSKIGNMTLYLNDGVETYRHFLENILSDENLDIKKFIATFFPNPNRPEEEFDYGDVMMGMIACQEMSMANPEMSLTNIFSNKKLVSDHNNRDRDSLCRPLGLENNSNTPYIASNYLVNIPVTYLLGSDDGATTLDQGLKHSQVVALGSKQVFVMTNGGHLPSLGLLQDNRDCNENDESCDSLKQNKIQVEIFEEAATGEFNISSISEKIDRFNNSGKLEWKLNPSVNFN